MTDATGTSSVIDEADPFGARAARRLREEKVVWLTTVGPSGAPAPNPVWFLWDGADSLLVYTMPTAARLKHLALNPLVALNFREDDGGGDVVVLAGTARVLDPAPTLAEVPGYLAKYAADIPAIGQTEQTFAATYSVALTVTLTRLRGF